MTTTATESPDGERLARLETWVESLELHAAQIRDDIRELRARMDRQFLWILGIIITMWVSLVALGVTAMITLLGRL